MVQKLANVSKDVDTSIEDMNRHAALAQTVVRDTFPNKSVALADLLQTFPGKGLQTCVFLWIKRLAMLLRPCRVISLTVSPKTKNV